MGQKCNPTSVRLCMNKFWSSIWYGKKDYCEKLHEDIMIRKKIDTMVESGAVSAVDIRRFSKKINLNIYSSKPWVILGKDGENVNKLKANLEKIVGSEISINVVEVKKADTNAKLIAESIAQQIRRRSSYKKAMNKAVQVAAKAGISGIRVIVSGRLNGAEIARTEGSKHGSIPLHTFRANIDYATAEANTTYGKIGIKVWTFAGYSKNTAYLDVINNVEESRDYGKGQYEKEINSKEPVNRDNEVQGKEANERVVN